MALQRYTLITECMIVQNFSKWEIICFSMEIVLTFKGCLRDSKIRKISGSTSAAHQLWKESKQVWLELVLLIHRAKRVSKTKKHQISYKAYPCTGPSFSQNQDLWLPQIIQMDIKTLMSFQCHRPLRWKILWVKITLETQRNH